MSQAISETLYRASGGSPAVVASARRKYLAHLRDRAWAGKSEKMVRAGIKACLKKLTNAGRKKLTDEEIAHLTR